MTKSQSHQINVRVPADVVAELDELAERGHVTRMDMARQLLLEGIQQRKREHALRLVREGKASKSRAAELAGMTLWELMDWLQREATPTPYSLQAAVEDVRRLVAPLALTERHA